MSHPRPFRFAVMATKATSGADRVETARKAEGLGSYVRVQGDAIDFGANTFSSSSTTKIVGSSVIREFLS